MSNRMNYTVSQSSDIEHGRTDPARANFDFAIGAIERDDKAADLGMLHVDHSTDL